MPNVILNTSPIQYLYQIKLLDLIPQLYGQAIVPNSVAEELAVGISLGIILPDISSLSWIQLKEAKSKSVLPLTAELGAGEREVLALAGEEKDTLVVLDDALARSYARILNIKLTGTLGIILKAKQEGLIGNISPILEQLDYLKFRVDSTTRNAVLKIAGELD